MPNTYVIKRVLFDMLGKEFTDEEFEDLCFEFGLEVEMSDTSEMFKRRKGEDEEEEDEKVKEKGKKKKKKEEEKTEPVFKVEVPANRYDLLSVEGIAIAFQCYLGLGKIPDYRIVNKENMEKVYVQPETKDVRPYCVAAIVRDVTFTDESFNSFIDLQDLLHQNICRRRKLVAMGTHDYDNMEGPITYEARKPEDIKFKPLNETTEMDGNEFMEHYSKDKQIKEYLPIIRDKERYPIFYDKNQTVLSLPPIKNSEATACSLKTKNVFIDITATDHKRAKIVCDILTTFLSRYSSSQYCIEQVEIIYPDGTTTVNPTLEEKDFELSLDYTNKLLGLKLTLDDVDSLAEKMMLKVVNKEDDKFTVRVPVVRSDILHACDIAEDLAIAYGYNNLEVKIPATKSFEKSLFLAKSRFTDLLRQELAQSGFIECLNMGLVSQVDIFENMRKECTKGVAVKVANSKTIEFNYFRNSLLPGLLKTLHTNKKEKLPHKVFECQDTVHIDPSNAAGATNKRTLALVYSNVNSSGMDLIHGILDLIMLKFGATRDAVIGYDLVLSDHPTFLPNMQVEIKFLEKTIGHFGIVHPEVLKAFKIVYPVGALEMYLDEVFDNFEEKST